MHNDDQQDQLKRAIGLEISIQLDASKLLAASGLAQQALQVLGINNPINSEGINRTLDHLYHRMKGLGFTVEDYDQACARLVTYSKQSTYTYSDYSNALIMLLVGAMPLAKALEQLDPNRPSDDSKDALRYLYASLYGGIPNYDRVNRWAVKGNGGTVVSKRVKASRRGYPKASYKEAGSTHQKRKAKKRGK